MSRDPKTGRRIVEKPVPAKKIEQKHGFEVYEEAHSHREPGLFERSQPWEPARPWERVKAAITRKLGIGKKKKF